MKVYTLTLVHPTKGTVDVLGVFSKPKVARQTFDKHYGMDTKKKWTKVTSTCRKFTDFYITESTLDGGIESE